MGVFIPKNWRPNFPFSSSGGDELRRLFILKTRCTPNLKKKEKSPNAWAG